MASLIIGGVTIPVSPGGISRDRNDLTDRARAFDGTYRASATGTAKRDWTFSTPPVTRHLADFYESILSVVTTQVCSGDIIGGSMNLAIRSEEFDNAGVWLLQNATIGANTGGAPDGSVTADKLEETTANGPHTAYQQIAGLVDNTVYTFSVYLRQQERTWALVAINGKDGTTRGAYFNIPIGAPAIGTILNGATPLMSTVGALSHYRCSVSATVGAGGSTPAVAIYTASADNVSSFAGTTGSGFHMHGAQLELGTALSSYIRTTSIALNTLTTNCCSEITGWSPVRVGSGHYVVLDFALREV